MYSIPFRSALLVPVVLSIMVSACSGKGGTEGATGSQQAQPPVVKSPAEIKVEYQPLDIPSAMKAGAEVPIRFEAKNVGSTTWSGKGDSPFRFGYHWSDPDGRGGDWTSVVWDDGARGLISVEVPPGRNAVVSMKVKALSTPAPTAKLVIAPLLEPGGWTTETPLVVTVNVK